MALNSSESNKSNQMLFFEERGKAEYPENNLSDDSRSRAENQQTQPTHGVESGNRSQATLVEDEYSNYCTIYDYIVVTLNEICQPTNDERFYPN